MPSPTEKLANSLKLLQKLQDNDGIAILNLPELSRTHRASAKMDSSKGN
ncbi:MAG: hypothetical protein IPN18_10580 [Ignavibacteriales bacterium]|nr:hypothetical protein [Ignavibacteriales bacterium]